MGNRVRRSRSYYCAMGNRVTLMFKLTSNKFIKFAFKSNELRMRRNEENPKQDTTGRHGSHTCSLLRVDLFHALSRSSTTNS
jgi:hypothetical protein